MFVAVSMPTMFVCLFVRRSVVSILSDSTFRDVSRPRGRVKIDDIQDEETRQHRDGRADLAAVGDDERLRW